MEGYGFSYLNDGEDYFQLLRTEVKEGLRSIKEEFSASIKELNDNICHLKQEIKQLAPKAATTKKLTDIIPLSVMQDAFDEIDELKDLCREKVWSDVNDDIKTKMIQQVENGLKAIDLDVPSHKDITKRVKAFYANRRSEELLKSDEEKSKRRKIEKKVNHRNFLARDRAVQEAIGKGLVTIDDEEEIGKIKKSVSKVDVNAVSPPRDNEDAIRHEKRKATLSKARAIKRKNEKENQHPQRVSRHFTSSSNEYAASSARNRSNNYMGSTSPSILMNRKQNQSVSDHHSSRNTMRSHTSFLGFRPSHKHQGTYPSTARPLSPSICGWQPPDQEQHGMRATDFLQGSNPYQQSVIQSTNKTQSSGRKRNHSQDSQLSPSIFQSLLARDTYGGYDSDATRMGDLVL